MKRLIAYFANKYGVDSDNDLLWLAVEVYARQQSRRAERAMFDQIKNSANED